MNPIDHHDVNWLAFRYVADEMSREELAAFEARLADDQPAREAVAAAVQLSQSIACAMNDSDAADETAVRVAARHRAVWSRRILWAGLGAAVCLTFVVLVRQVFHAEDVADSPVVRQNREPHSQQLALVWSQTRQAADGELEMDSDADIDSSVSDETSSAPFSTPSWIIAALTDHEISPRPDRDPADDLEEL